MRPGIQRPQFKGDPPNAAPAPFSPTDIAGLQMWLDGSDATKMFTGTYADRLTATANPTTNGDPLCRWEDKSGNANHWYCNADGTRPTYALTATLNSLTGNTLGRWDRPTVGGSATTWYIVHKYDGSNPAFAQLCSKPASFMTLAMASSLSGRLSFVRDNVALIDSGFAQGTSARVYRVEFDGSLSTYWTLATGTQTVRQQVGAVGLTPPSAAFLNAPGQIYDVYVWNKILSTDEKTSIQTYIANKWGI